jgi:hypothetical protein
MDVLVVFIGGRGWWVCWWKLFASSFSVENAVISRLTVCLQSFIPLPPTHQVRHGDNQCHHHHYLSFAVSVVLPRQCHGGVVEIRYLG